MVNKMNTWQIFWICLFSCAAICVIAENAGYKNRYIELKDEVLSKLYQLQKDIRALKTEDRTSE